jgi:FkbM family methyltransferase
MAEAWYDCDKPTPPDFVLMRRHGLKPGATVFNLGAFQCVVALMLAQEVGRTGRVVAVEGNPHNVNVAHTNCHLNDVDWLDVINGAITASPGIVGFAPEFNGRIDDAGGPRGTKVRALTIDELADTHGFPDVVYMDIEGHELEALHGGARVLADGRATWSIEVHPQSLVGDSPAELIRLLTGRRLWLSKAALTGPNVEYEEYAGGPLPGERFFIVAAPPPAAGDGQTSTAR